MHKASSYVLENVLFRGKVDCELHLKVQKSQVYVIVYCYTEYIPKTKILFNVPVAV